MGRLRHNNDPGRKKDPTGRASANTENGKGRQLPAIPAVQKKQANTVAQRIRLNKATTSQEFIQALREDGRVLEYEAGKPGSCYDAVNEILDVFGEHFLIGQGPEKSLLGITVWNNTREAEADHLVLVVKLNGETIYIDPTAGQFGGGPFYGSDSDWKPAFLGRERIMGKGVKCQPYKTLSSAESGNQNAIRGVFENAPGEIYSDPPVYSEELKEDTSTEDRHTGGETNTPAKAKKGRCFITTACMTARGLPDDCEELQTLRMFRDTYISGLKNGKELVEVYYTFAPAIVTAIDRRGDAPAVYSRLFKTLTKCVKQIKRGQNEHAFAGYVNLVMDLSAEYLSGAMLPGHFSCHGKASRAKSASIHMTA